MELAYFFMAVSAIAAIVTAVLVIADHRQRKSRLAR